MSESNRPNPYASPPGLEHSRLSPQPSRTNGFAITGFVFSLVGLCIFPVAAPLGLLFSLIGLRRPPRGLAIAGVTIGAIATLGWLMMLILFWIGLTYTFGGGSFAAGWESFTDAIEIETEVDVQWDITGTLPQSLDTLPLSTDDLTDYWGNRYRYEPNADGWSYKIFSNGPDGLPGTSDDLDIGP